ncbi:TetR/AcrR family transcriptional regulator [Streptomyces daliensis]|uniref:TetR/AcrR family transcriptional regulator n=1 Tax=Streptomyces daliensis TaxID=299421 RepID=A0A8T4IUH1_9ACTN|nr:TetR/AcrR family transcriptional regulator [Streptomyces daliensis]
MDEKSEQPARTHPGRTGRTPDTSRRSESSRKAILDASMRLVGEVGYNKLTIEAIAARAGVGKQTIYRWWPSKAAVLLDAFTGVVDEESYQQGIPDTGDLAADLKAVLRATVDEFNTPSFEAPYRALAAAGAADPSLSEQFVRRLMEPGRDVYVRRFEAAREAGQMAEDIDAAFATELLLGPFQARWLMRTEPLTYEFADTLVDYVLRGIAPR